MPQTHCFIQPALLWCKWKMRLWQLIKKTSPEGYVVCGSKEVLWTGDKLFLKAWLVHNSSACLSNCQLNLRFSSNELSYSWYVLLWSWPSGICLLGCHLREGDSSCITLENHSEGIYIWDSHSRHLLQAKEKNRYLGELLLEVIFAICICKKYNVMYLIWYLMHFSICSWESSIRGEGSRKTLLYLV